MQPILSLIDNPKSRHQNPDLHPFFLHRLRKFAHKVRYFGGLQKGIDLAGYIKNYGVLTY